MQIIFYLPKRVFLDTYIKHV